MTNKWLNPPSRITTEFPPQDAVSYTPFSTIKKQVKKKKLTKMSKRERIADKSISLAERVGNGECEKTI